MEEREGEHASFCFSWRPGAAVESGRMFLSTSSDLSGRCFRCCSSDIFRTRLVSTGDIGVSSIAAVGVSCVAMAIDSAGLRWLECESTGSEVSIGTL